MENHFGKVSVKVGTTTAWVRPENVVARTAALVKASKVPSFKQARGKVMRTGSTRQYPMFMPGMSVSTYVMQYCMLNLAVTHGRYGEAQGYVEGFFEPLSKKPMPEADTQCLFEEVAE